jgi:hypothetical protein
VNIVVAHIMYHQWKVGSPKKARQVNALSFGCFAIQMLGFCLVFMVVAGGFGLVR